MADRPVVDFENQDLQIFIGDDPCVICLHDSSINRTFPPNEWYWDFGDKIKYCNFELPGDDKIFSDFSGEKRDKLNTLLDTIGGENLSMRPLKGSSYGTSLSGQVHYTGIYMLSSTASHTASIGGDLENTREAGTKNDPVKIGNVNVVANSCGKTNKTADAATYNPCGGQDVFGNGVYHVYKGAGVYPVYMASWTRDQNEEGYPVVRNRQGYEPFEEGQIPTSAAIINYGLVVVKPRCPCFLDFGPVVNGDTSSRCVGVTAENFSCRYHDINSSSVTGYLDNVDNLVSAYAPFMKITVKGDVIPMSFPIDKMYWDWCDWFTDFSDEDTISEIGVPDNSSGWAGHWLGDGEIKKTITGTHVYTIPGLYSLYFGYDYLTGGVAGKYDDIASAIEMLNMFIDDDCYNAPALKDYFMLVELPPKFADVEPITVGTRSENQGSTELTISGITVKPGLSAGSYPINRIDWDFGDGTPIFTLCKNEYVSAGDVSKISDIWKFHDDYTSAVPDEQHYINHLNGSVSDVIYEPYVEDYTLSHVYHRTNVDSGYAYTISCTAYAENTHTFAAASVTISGFENRYPDFSKIEGDVKVVDTRNYGSSDYTIIVLNGKNSGELYNVKVEDK